MAFTTPGHAYNHLQAVGSTTWNINHNLNNSSPIVSAVLDLGGTMTVVIPASVVVVDANNVTLTFTQAVATFQTLKDIRSLTTTVLRFRVVSLSLADTLQTLIRLAQDQTTDTYTVTIPTLHQVLPISLSNSG